jgi:hypothetical protein
LSILSEHERSLAAYIAPRHHQAAFKVFIMPTPLEDGAGNGNEKVPFQGLLEETPADRAPRSAVLG